jgi:cobyrinic acid a,c-diamide synthase
MALVDTRVDGQGTAHRLWGLLPGTALLGQRLAALGPQAWSRDGQTLRGHSFHWSRLDTRLVPWQHTRPADGRAGGDAGAAGAGEPIYRLGALRASWFHPWFPSAPTLAARLFLPD